jgi:hypothetical protein
MRPVVYFISAGRAVFLRAALFTSVPFDLCAESARSGCIQMMGVLVAGIFEVLFAMLKYVSLTPEVRPKLRR